jgi:ABC-type phosphate transport system auxiliary subunit
MKISLFSLLLILAAGFAKAAVLLNSKPGNSRAPKARKLVVYPGFNEVEATTDYKSELKELIDRVQTLHRQLENFQQNTSRDVSAVVQKLDAQTDKNALDSMLNNLFLSTQRDIANNSN